MVNNITKRRIITIGCIGLFLLSNILILPATASKFNNIKTHNTENSIQKNTNIILLSDLEADLKIRKPGGDWEDQSIIASVGLILDFKITVETNRDYVLVGILVKLPLIDNTPMFNYIEWSSWPMPIFPIGEWAANDTDVSWAWFIVGPSWEKEMTFKAKIIKTGSSSVELTVIALKDVNGDYDKVTDNTYITAEKNKYTHNPNLLSKKFFILLNNIALFNKFTSIYF